MKALNNMVNKFSTITNISYVIAGIALWNVNIVLALLAIMLGIASTGFHWWRTDAWHKFDIVAIYYVFATIAGYLWFDSIGIILGLIIGAIAHWSFTDYSRYSRKIIGVFGGLCLLNSLLTKSAEENIAILVFFLFAFLFSKIGDSDSHGETGIIYDFHHAIWHIYSAIGIYYLII